eukprot:Nk52_evm1s1177 gene=Nk52_evmTU1s1177
MPDSLGRKTPRHLVDSKITLSQELLEREAEYLKLNAQLEARTSQLSKEAEEALGSVLKQQEDTLSNLDPVYREKLGTAKYPSTSSEKKIVPSKTKKTPSIKKKDPSLSALDIKIRTQTDSTLAADVDIDLTDLGIEDDSVMSAAKEMGSEATNRFLKAKVKVMQEELERLTKELESRNFNSEDSEKKIKEAVDEKNALLKKNQALEAQVERNRKAAASARLQVDSRDTEIQTLKKDLATAQKASKNASIDHGSIEIRLNRALEEIEKYKVQLVKAGQENHDLGENYRMETKKLVEENKVLNKQKNELVAAFKKQLKLIDILKRQKIHIEAAKMLQFTEDEFIKALDWGPN